MRKNNQLNQNKLYQIYSLWEANKNSTKISRILGWNKKTIYRDLKRNHEKRGSPSPGQAHQFAIEKLNPCPIGHGIPLDY